MIDIPIFDRTPCFQGRTPLDLTIEYNKREAELLFYDPPTVPGCLQIDTSEWLPDFHLSMTFAKATVKIQMHRNI